MTIRPARDADLPAIASLVNSAYRGESSRKGWTTEDGLLDGQRIDVAMLRDEIGAGHPCTILTLWDDEEASLLGCVKLDYKNDRLCDLGMLTVAPEAQAGGLGKRLLLASEDFAREQGDACLRITVIHVRDTLIAWYERHGFRRTGETKPFPYGDARFGLPKRDDLYFVVLSKAL